MPEKASCWPCPQPNWTADTWCPVSTPARSDLFSFLLCSFWGSNLWNLRICSNPSKERSWADSAISATQQKLNFGYSKANCRSCWNWSAPVFQLSPSPTRRKPEKIRSAACNILSWHPWRAFSRRIIAVGQQTWWGFSCTAPEIQLRFCCFWPGFCIGCSIIWIFWPSRLLWNSNAGGIGNPASSAPGFSYLWVSLASHSRIKFYWFTRCLWECPGWSYESSFIWGCSIFMQYPANCLHLYRPTERSS